MEGWATWSRRSLLASAKTKTIPQHWILLELKLVPGWFSPPSDSLGTRMIAGVKVSRLIRSDTDGNTSGFTSDQKVAGSSPAGRVINYLQLIVMGEFLGCFLTLWIGEALIFRCGIAEHKGYPPTVWPRRSLLRLRKGRASVSERPDRCNYSLKEMVP